MDRSHSQPRDPVVSPRASNFYVTGGTLRPDAPSYVERQADRDLYEGLLGGEFCYVLTSRQMGKSSLMRCLLYRPPDRGVAVRRDGHAEFARSRDCLPPDPARETRCDRR